MSEKQLRKWGESLERERKGGLGEPILTYADEWRDEVAALREQVEQGARDYQKLVDRLHTLREKYRLLEAQHARLCDQVYEEDGETLKIDTLDAEDRAKFLALTGERNALQAMQARGIDEIIRLERELEQKQAGIDNLQEQTTSYLRQAREACEELEQERKAREELDAADHAQILDLQQQLSSSIAECVALRAQIKLLYDYCFACGGISGYHEGCNGTTGLITLHAECAALRKDVERYRWLRSRFNDCGAQLHFCKDSNSEWQEVQQNVDAGSDLDAAIDQARERT